MRRRPASGIMRKDKNIGRTSMLKYPCLVLDHDDTVVQSEATVNYPFFCYILNQFRPGTKITLHEYTEGCFRLGFADMCRKWYNFTEQEIVDEYHGWQKYIVDRSATFPPTPLSPFLAPVWAAVRSSPLSSFWVFCLPRSCSATPSSTAPPSR